MTEAKYEELVSALTNAGVAMRDVNGEYRSTYDIMADISAKWSELTSMQKAALATNLAGTRQQNVFYSIIEQFQEASGAMTAMTDSAGSLQEAHEQHLDSIDGKLNQLKATFQELSTDVLNSKMFKSLIDSLTKVVSALKWLLTFGNGFVPKLATMLISGNLAVKLLTTVVLKVTALYKAILAAGSATAVLKKGLTALSNHAMLIALTAIVTTIVEMANASKRAAEYLGNTKEEVEEEEKTLEDLASQYRNTQSDIDSLNSQLSETNTRLTTLLKKDKLTIIEQAEVTRLQTVNDELERQLVLKQKLLTGQQREAANKFASDYYEWETPTPTQDDRDAWTKFWDQVYAGWYWTTRPQDREGAQDLVNNAWGVPSGSINVGELSNQLYFNLRRYETYGGQNWLDAAIQEMGELQDKKAAIADIDYNLLPADAQSALKEIEEYELWFTRLTGTAEQTASVLFGSRHLSEANNILHDIAQDEELTVDKVLQLAQGNEAIQAMIDEYSDTFKLDSEEDAIQGIIEHYNTLNEQAQQETIPTLQEIKEEVEGLHTALDNLQSAYDTLSNIIDEYNEKGYFSLDNLQDLLKLEPEYLNLLIDENGQLNLNSQAYYAYIEAKAKSLVLGQIKSLYESVLEMTAEEAQAYANAKAYDAEADSILDAAKALTSYYAVKAQQKDAEEHTSAYTDAFTRAIDTAANYVAIYDNVIQNLSNSEQELTSSASDATDALEQQKDALQDTLDDLEDAQSAVKSLIDRVIAYIKKQKEIEKDALQEQKDAFDDLIESEKEKLRLKYEEIEAEKTLADLQNSVAKDALAASIASLDDSAAGKKALKAANDNLATSRSNLTDELNEREYNARIDALDKLKDTQDKYYDSEIQKLDDYLSNARKIYEDACYMIDHDTGDLYAKLWDYTYNYTTETKTEFDYMWNEAQSALSRYRDANIDLLTVLEIMQTDIYRINGEINTLSNMIDNESRSVDNLSSSWANATANAKAYRQALIDEANTPKWYFKWKDVYGTVHTYESAASDQIDAVNDILSQLGWDSRGGKFVKEHMYHYAQGTLSALGGVSEVNEDGHEIRVLNKGDGILTSKITRNLSNLGSNPVQFLADAGKELLSKISNSGIMGGLFGVTPTAAAVGVGSSGDMPITIVNHINGDVNPSTLKALEKAQKQITNDAINGVFKKTLGLRNSSRVR